MPIISRDIKRAADNILIVKAAVSGQAVQLLLHRYNRGDSPARQGKKIQWSRPPASASPDNHFQIQGIRGLSRLHHQYTDFIVLLPAVQAG